MPNNTAPAWPDMLTCPHCGGDELAHGFQYPPPQGMAQCYSCGAAVIADTEEEAIATWNRRTPSEQSAREAAAVAAALLTAERACNSHGDTLAQNGLPLSSISVARTCAVIVGTQAGDTTALDRLLAEAREAALREAAALCDERGVDAQTTLGHGIVMRTFFRARDGIIATIPAARSTPA